MSSMTVYQVDLSAGFSWDTLTWEATTIPSWYSFNLGSGEVTATEPDATVTGSFYYYSGNVYFAPDADQDVSAYVSPKIDSFSESVAVEQLETSTTALDAVDTAGGEHTLSDGNDTFVGSDGADTVYAGDGRDRIEAGDGDDVIYGEAGADSIYGMAGNDTIDGGAGNDKITGGDGDDVIKGGDGYDTIRGGEGNDHIDGGGNWDTIYGEGGNDTLLGGDERDTIDGGTGNDSIEGGAGQDRLYGKGGDDYISGGADSDTLYGGDGNDTLTGGGDGINELYGGAGDDVFLIQSGTGYDIIEDFTLNDTEADQLDVSGLTNWSGDPVTVDDVTIFTDSLDNAVLYFPNGELVQLTGINAYTLTTDDLIRMGIPCFAQGTMIRTPNGDVPIETLRVGDLVQTLDNGVQPIVWIGARHLSRRDLEKHPKLQPVRIRAGSLGNDRDLIVSPQHGMLSTQGAEPSLVRAIHLARNGGPGFRVARGIKSVSYYHLMFERHEIIFAENAPSESFYPGPMALNALGPAERAEISLLFPELLSAPAGCQVYGPTARQFLKRKEVSRDTARLFDPVRAFA